MDVHSLALNDFSKERGRRHFVTLCSIGLGSTLISLPNASIAEEDFDSRNGISIKHPYMYTPQWTGSALPWLSLREAVEISITNDDGFQPDKLPRWPMGRWPDPILRRSADDVEDSLFGTVLLKLACKLLQQTAVVEGAVGLAAQQCGVNARIVYLERKAKGSSVTLINPRIEARSAESDMRVWRENCLVLPPSFEATVLRDSWIDVSYNDWTSSNVRRQIRLYGEEARAAQHELDHDRGILVTDLVSLEELENDAMRTIELPGRKSRVSLAFTRYVG